MKASDQYYPVVLFIRLNKVVLGLESVDEMPKCDRSVESYWAVLFCGAFYYAVEGGSSFLSLWMKSLCVPIQMKAVVG